MPEEEMEISESEFGELVKREAAKRMYQMEQFRFAREMLENENISPDTIQKYWGFLSKESKLSNLNDIDVKKCELNFQIAQVTDMLYMPDFEVTPEMVREGEVVRHVNFLMLKRSTGGKDRERALFQTEVKQLLTNEVEQPKGGILARLGLRK